LSLFYAPEIPEGNFALDAEEARHAVKVLRLQKGDAIHITDGKGKFYSANINLITKSTCEFSISSTVNIPRRDHRVHIAIAPTKNIDRIEWFVEKSTELGIEEISFIQCHHSERKTINIERIQKKAISALKQSGQAWLPRINPMVAFEQIIQLPSPDRFIAHVDQDNSRHLKEARPNGNYTVLIGPEGDFTKEEIREAIRHGFQKIGLGKSVLRTETAGIAACQILNLINE